MTGLVCAALWVGSLAAAEEVPPPAAFVDWVQAKEPGLFDFRAYTRYRIDETYAVATVSAAVDGARLSQEFPRDRRVMHVAVTRDDLPVLHLARLVQEVQRRKGHSQLFGYRLDRLSRNQITFVVDDDFYGYADKKLMIPFDIDAAGVFEPQEIGFLAVHALATEENHLWAAATYRWPANKDSFHALIHVPLDQSTLRAELVGTIAGESVPELHEAVTVTGGIAFAGNERRAVRTDGIWRVEPVQKPSNPVVVKMPSPETNQEVSLYVEDAMHSGCMPDGHRFLVAPGGVVILDADGNASVYPVTNFEASLLREKRHDPRIVQNPHVDFELQNFIGAWAVSGCEMVYGTDFYDGEGISGIGALGYFDLTSREFRYEFVDELSSWSTTAILVQDEHVTLVLARRPEGATYSGGILHYDRKTRGTRRLDLPHVAKAMARHGDYLVAATEDGLYIYRGNTRTRIGLTMDRDGAPELFHDSTQLDSNRD